MDREFIKKAYQLGFASACDDFLKSAAPLPVSSIWRFIFRPFQTRKVLSAAFRQAQGQVNAANATTQEVRRQAANRVRRLVNDRLASEVNRATEASRRQIQDLTQQNTNLTGQVSGLQTQLSGAQRSAKHNKYLAYGLGGTTAASILAGFLANNQQKLNNLREWKGRESARVDRAIERPRW